MKKSTHLEELYNKTLDLEKMVINNHPNLSIHMLAAGDTFAFIEKANVLIEHSPLPCKVYLKLGDDFDQAIHKIDAAIESFRKQA